MKLSQNMVGETVTLQVPSQLYTRARQAAGQNQQALEQLLVNALASSFIGNITNDVHNSILLATLLGYRTV